MKAYFVTFGVKRGWASRYRDIQPPSIPEGFTSKDLALADSEHFGATYRTGALSRWFAVLHGYTLSILHLPLSAALYTVSLHVSPPSRLLY